MVDGRTHGTCSSIASCHYIGQKVDGCRDVVNNFRELRLCLDDSVHEIGCPVRFLGLFFGTFLVPILNERTCPSEAGPNCLGNGEFAKEIIQYGHLTEL